MSSSSSGKINIAASAQKIKVDNRFSLQFYYRIADNILKQADIFRAEGNIIDLYIMLLRFLSLATETIPCHRDYRGSLQFDKVSMKKKSLNAVSELEDLKPAVRLKIDELSRKNTYQSNGWNQKNSLDSSSVKKQNISSYTITKAPQIAAQEYVYQVPRIQQFSHAKPIEDQVRRLSLSIPRPKEETLSRHSILGPNGLRGQWQAPSSNFGICYPSNVDLTPVEIPRENSRLHPVEDGTVIKKDAINSELEGLGLQSTLVPKDDIQIDHVEELASLISFEAIETPVQTEIVRQPSPPPVLADVQDLVPKTSPSANGTEISLSDGLVCSEAPLELHISTAVMDSFLRMAKSNTDRNLETCGILAGLLKNRKFYVTALIIPKQESTSDSCNATNEEEIFEVQDKQSLFPLGWIHNGYNGRQMFPSPMRRLRQKILSPITVMSVLKWYMTMTHPTQSCFMSSIDVHTHYSYQVMLPEAIAIVMAPRDSSRKHGIFRLTTPGGMGVIRGCPRRGFHAHDPPSDGSPIYKQCTDVYMDPKLKFDVIDLR